MKKGIIAMALLLSGALFISPITTSANSIKNNIDTVIVEEQQDNKTEEVLNEVKNETVEKEETVSEENTYKPETNNNQSEKVETNIDKTEEVVNKETETEKEVVLEENNKTEEVVESNGMSQSQAQSVLNQYLNNIGQGDMTYVYQGDENTFGVIKEKGIRGYVFLPNVETDMAYLVDKDSGSIYYFHPSGYFELV